MMGLPGPFIVPGQGSADTSVSVLGLQSPILRSVIGAFHGFVEIERYRGPRLAMSSYASAWS
jgi:hypothetical protein